MQMAASAFDILIGSVSDNIGLRWVWTNQRCNRTACIHRMQFKGLGFPNKHFATQKVFLYRRKHCLQMQTLYIRLPCLRVLWSFSMYFLVWKSSCMPDRPFSSLTWSGRLFLCKTKCTQLKQVVCKSGGDTSGFLCLNRRCDLLKIQRDFCYDKSDPVVSRN